MQGIRFLDAVVLGAYACLGVVFAAPAAAAGVSILRAILIGSGLAWSMLLTGIVVVYLRHSVVAGPDLRTLAECAIFGVALSAAVAAMVSWVAGRRGSGVARLIARLALFGLLALFYLKARTLPDAALTGAAICTAMAIIFLALGRRTSHA